MLKNICIIFFVMISNCFASIIPPMVVKNEHEKVRATRVFCGKIVKTGFWQSLRSEYSYRLYDKDRCIACLDFDEKVRSPEILKAFVGKKVVVKGTPRYMNKEPYLVITVDDVGEQ